jgi:hypothetical protein
VKRSAIVKKLDKIFSIWIRSKDADHAGMVDCFTCGVTKNWKYEIDGIFNRVVSTKPDGMNKMFFPSVNGVMDLGGVNNIDLQKT